MYDRQLRYFLVCAQERSFTKASERLGMSQSALSQQMKQFERQLEQTLFIRKGRGVALTAAGVGLQRRVESCFLELDQVIEEFKYQQGIVTGTISIASVHPVLSYLLPKVIADYTRQHPRVGFSLYCGGSLKVIEMVRSQAADFGLIYDNVACDMELEPLFTEKLSAVFSSLLPDANKILDTRSLPEHTPLIVFQRGYSLRRVTDRALKGASCCLQIETETTDTMLNLAYAGAGVCFLPAYIFRQHPGLYSCDLMDVDMRVGVARIAMPGVPMSPVASQLIDNIKKVAMGRAPG